MAHQTADIVICGAGIAGIAVAYHLAVRYGIRDVALVDERDPLSLTSDKSTECYRNWWPGPDAAMVSLMNRSIDLLEELASESDNIFQLNRRGYLYATADPTRVAAFKRATTESTDLGAGPTRFYSGQAGGPTYRPAPAYGFTDQPIGADLIYDPLLIREHFPYLTEQTIALIHARRCGWFSAQQLGMYLLERACERGVRLIRARLESVDVQDEQVRAVRLRRPEGMVIVNTPVFVNAAGPFLADVGDMLGINLPVFSELHIKVAFHDYLRVIPRDAPLLIWTDPISLDWTDEERMELAESEETRHLLAPLPAGVHARPEGGPDSDMVLLLWTYDRKQGASTFPFTSDPFYPEIALRGMATMIPGLKAYFGRLPSPVVDGGYYTKTRENRPLIGPLPIEGAYILGALSGFGLMASCAAGELLAKYIVGEALPHYAPVLNLNRYADPAYQALLTQWNDTGQL